MASISTSTQEGVFSINKKGFLGLNENPDGDSKLKMGEASICNNWKVTRDGNLKRRNGTHTMLDLDTGKPVVGMWSGMVNGKFTVLAASNNRMFKVYEEDSYCCEDLGYIVTDNEVSFFGFSNIVYILNGKEYYYYDGYNFDTVKGYSPVVYTARSPSGSEGTILEEVNKLNGLRRVWFSPDGTSTEFVLPEEDLISVDYVKTLATDELMNPTLYTIDLLNGKVTFTTAPTRGTNTIEIQYTAPALYRQQVCNMRYAELFSGTQDTRVFIYGDGSNEAFYSSIDYDGVPRADYFPDLNEVAVADSNTAITGMIRHYSQLICYKESSAYTIAYGLITLDDDNSEAGFYVTPINRAIGNEALGQVRLIENSPYTFFGSDMYMWKNTSSYSSNLTVDERQAKRVSDRIFSTLGDYDFSKIRTFDDNFNKEFYVVHNKEALVYNVVSDAWYRYTNFDASSLCSLDEEVLLGTSDGKIKLFSDKYTNDDGTAFRSYWKSGSTDFGKSYMQKMMSQIWVVIKPEHNASVIVTVQTDKKSEYREKTVTSTLISFQNIDFSHFGFLVNRKPKSKKLKIKAKKFTFLNIIFETEEKNTTALILGAEARVRFTSYVK